MKVKIAVFISSVLLLVVIGCATQNQTTNGNKVLNIGIIQLVSHRALDASREGFIAALADSGFHVDKEIKLDFNDAMGDMSNLSTISDRFVNNKVDLVLAITTPAALAIASKTETIPIIATAVTSFANAELVKSDEVPGTNVTGTSDMNPVAAQISLIKELFLDAETVGFLYNSSESNSVLQIEIAKESAEKLGLKWTEVTVTSTNDVQQAMQSLVTRCDVIYLPTDNTVSSAMATISAVAAEAKIPTVCGEENQVYEGGLVSMGVDYYELGYKAGLMAVEIINGTDPANMPIQFADESDDIIINGFIAEEIGFSVPEKFVEFIVYPED